MHKIKNDGAWKWVPTATWQPLKTMKDAVEEPARNNKWFSSMITFGIHEAKEKLDGDWVYDDLLMGILTHKAQLDQLYEMSISLQKLFDLHKTMQPPQAPLGMA